MPHSDLVKQAACKRKSHLKLKERNKLERARLRAELKEPISVYIPPEFTQSQIWAQQELIRNRVIIIKPDPSFSDEQAQDQRRFIQDRKF